MKEGRKVLRCRYALLALTLLGTLSGCGHYEVNTGRGNIPGYFIRSEMQEADRAVEAARAAGKDKVCPADFKQAEDAKNNAYDVFRACHTEEGAALAKQATAQANALCPPQQAKVVPVPAPVPAAPAPAITARLSVTPDSITRGQAATLTWTSENATNCDIQPGIGPVPPQGSRTISPTDTATYTLICSGKGGSVEKTANVAVTAPAPTAKAVQPPEKTKLCSPAVIDIHFDTNKADIKPQYRDELKKLADFLNEFPKASGTIEGHTDSVGSKAANMKLSQRRAESVRNYLIKEFGIAPERIKAIGFGPTKPIADNGTKAGKERNRRIESNFTCN